jgi:hypothetical protein
MSDVFTTQSLQTLDPDITWTYTSLCNYLQKFLDRTDSSTVNNIPRFISLAESRLASDLKVLSQVNTVQFTLPQTVKASGYLAGGSSNPQGPFIIEGFNGQMNYGIEIQYPPQSLPYSVTISKPQGYRMTKSLAVVTPQGRNYMYNRSYEYVQEYLQDFSTLNLADQSNYTGWIYYSDIDISNIIIGPLVEDMAYTFEWQYYAEVQPLSSAVQQNYFTIYYPLALIYAALIWASEYLRSDNRSMQWEQTYQSIIGGLNKENSERQMDNSNLRLN